MHSSLCLQTRVFTLDGSDDIHQAQICDLVPHTDYRFALSAKFVTRGKLDTYGLWSEPRKCHQLTSTTSRLCEHPYSIAVVNIHVE